MLETSAYEQEREANIARNRALLEQLELKDAVATLGVSVKPKPAPKTKAKPIPATKRLKRELVEEAPRRQSARLRKEVVDPNETPAQRRKRTKEAEERIKKEEEDRALAEEQTRLAKRPRPQDLDLSVLTSAEELGADEVNALRGSLQAITNKSIPRGVGNVDAWVYDGDKGGERESTHELKKRLGKMKIVSRAKVTQDRIYSAAYHPEPTKDLIFFGDKHGELGIWDARASAQEVADEDDDVTPVNEEPAGKYWHLQQHWPATPKSSISSIRIDPIDSHSLYTTSYDCTIRQFSFVSGVSRQIYSSSDVLITSLEMMPSGHEIWISDVAGGVTQLDLREGPSHARWYGLSDQKIGNVSINPTSPHLILTASNSRYLKIWDTRKLESLGKTNRGGATSSSTPQSLSETNPGEFEFDFEKVQKFLRSKQGNSALRGEHSHGKSVTSAYWDPRGRSIVSTCYDDTLRLWELDAGKYDSSPVFPALTPFSRINHNCQTGKWLTLLRAVWNPNPDVYPHFTIGSMDHSLVIYSCKGELLARLSDARITATQAVTCSHPSVVERCATGNGSGRCVLWAPPDVE